MIFIMNGLSDFPRAQELSPSRSRHTHAYAQIYLGFYLFLFMTAPLNGIRFDEQSKKGTRQQIGSSKKDAVSRKPNSQPDCWPHQSGCHVLHAGEKHEHNN